MGEEHGLEGLEGLFGPGETPGWLPERFAAIESFLASLEDPGAKMALLLLEDIKQMTRASMDSESWGAEHGAD